MSAARSVLTSPACSPNFLIADWGPFARLPGPDLHRLIAPALPGAFPHLVGDGEQPGRQGGAGS